jgi:hypothetical protein
MSLGSCIAGGSGSRGRTRCVRDFCSPIEEDAGLMLRERGSDIWSRIRYYCRRPCLRLPGYAAVEDRPMGQL